VRGGSTRVHCASFAEGQTEKVIALAEEILEPIGGFLKGINSTLRQIIGNHLYNCSIEVNPTPNKSFKRTDRQPLT
jgi:isocitrate dehydrogenase